MRKQLVRSRLLLATVLLTLLVVALVPVPGVGVGSSGVATASAAVLYVTPEGAGVKDGSSWANAWDGRDLQGAIDAAAPGTQVWIAAGTYLPSEKRGGTLEKHRSFALKNGVEVYGGFAGWETSLAQRDWTANRTLLSGDLDGDGQWDFDGDACHVFYHPEGIDRTAVLDGVVISGAGGCIGDHGHEDKGGGMYNANGSSPTLRNVVFERNRSGFGGAALHMDGQGTRPWLENVLIRGNQTNQAGGAMTIWRGSAPVLVNVAIVGNRVVSDASALSVFHVGTDSIVLVNVTIAGNAAGNRGAIFAQGSEGGRLVIRNSIVYGNLQPGDVIVREACLDCGGPALDVPAVDIAHSVIQGSGGSGTNWNGNLGTDGGGNLDVDPRFRDPRDGDEAPTAEGDYRLRDGSPAIDAGDDAVFGGGEPDLPDLSGVGVDAEGGLRSVGAAMDMGAYEYPDDRFPAWPSGAQLEVDASVPGQATLSWSAADDTDIASYRLFVDGASAATVAADVYSRTLTGLAGSYVFAVRAVDAAGHETADLTAPATVTAPPLAVATASLPAAVVGVPYTFTLQASGGTPPYTWSVVSGSLPPGLSLASVSGAVYGTPTAAGSFAFTVQVSDSSPPVQTATRSFSLTVAGTTGGDDEDDPGPRASSPGGPGGTFLEAEIWPDEGGVAEDATGALRLEVPPGALSPAIGEAVRIRVRELGPEQAAALLAGATVPAGVILLGHVFEFEAETAAGVEVTDFAQPVTLSIALPPQLLNEVGDPEKVGLFRLNADGSLNFVGGRLVDGRLVVELRGFSRYVLAGVQIAFPDLQGHWARRDAELLAAKYVVRGRPDGRFDPDAPLTRAELASLAARVLGLPVAAGAAAPFSDVGSQDWFAAEVAAATEAGLVRGYEDGTFRPHEVVTREQAVAVVVRAWRWSRSTAALPDAERVRELLAPYADAGQVAAWAAGEWTLALQEGLVQGLSGGQGLRLGPGEPLTRAQAAALLARLWRRL